MGNGTRFSRVALIDQGRNHFRFPRSSFHVGGTVDAYYLISFPSDDDEPYDLALLRFRLIAENTLIGILSNTRYRPQSNGIHNPGELNRCQLERCQPGGICHVESIVLGSLRKPAS